MIEGAGGPAGGGGDGHSSSMSGGSSGAGGSVHVRVLPLPRLFGGSSSRSCHIGKMTSSSSTG